MSNIFVLAHKRTVGSGRLLADSIGAICITPLYKRKIDSSSLVINFGVSQLPPSLKDFKGEVINEFIPVKKGVNKLVFFREMNANNVPTLSYTTSASQALGFFSEDYHPSRRKVFGRAVLTGSGGKGITVFNDAQEFSNNFHKQCYKLYTQNFPKTKEYRVHVINGEAVCIAQKRAMSAEKLKEFGIEHRPDSAIRNYKNGWVFANEVQGDTTEVQFLARKCLNSLGLDFGAVDVLTTGEGDSIKEIAICEVNTAPSLSGGTTLKSYINTFEKHYLSGRKVA